MSCGTCREQSSTDASDSSTCGSNCVFFNEEGRTKLTHVRQSTTWPTHALRPALQNSRSTSCDCGTSPSAPRPPLSSRRDAASARAAAQDRMEYHLNRHACSTHSGYVRAFSLDQRPPVSNANTTSRARAPGRTSSGYVRAFFRFAWARATPSRSAAPFLGSPLP